MAFILSLSSNAKALQKSLDKFALKQLPFALAKTLNVVAQKIKTAEEKGFKEVFKSPSPFTQKSIGVQSARKNQLQATVYVKDKTAAYLQPYEFGGVHQLSGKALLNPKQVPLNTYGQISRGKMAQYKGRPDIFIGKVKTRNGVINGVWQRPMSAQQARQSRLKGQRIQQRNRTDHLKLLIRFGNALPVRQHLHYRARANSAIQRNFTNEFHKAMRLAIATAKL